MCLKDGYTFLVITEVVYTALYRVSQKNILSFENVDERKLTCY